MSLIRKSYSKELKQIKAWNQNEMDQMAAEREPYVNLNLENRFKDIDHEIKKISRRITRTRTKIFHFSQNRYQGRFKLNQSVLNDGSFSACDQSSHSSIFKIIETDSDMDSQIMEVQSEVDSEDSESDPASKKKLQDRLYGKRSFHGPDCPYGG